MKIHFKEISVMRVLGCWAVLSAALLLTNNLPAYAAGAGASDEDKPKSVAAADAGTSDNNMPKFDFGLSAGLSLMSLRNTHFGLGQQDVTYYAKDISRTEFYLAPRANMQWNVPEAGTVYGGFRPVGSFTNGDGDSWGLTASEHYNFQLNQPPSLVGKSMYRIDVDSAYLGWKSGDKLSFLDADGLDVSFGRQNFQLGDGMVLVDGNDEANQSKGIYWLDPRQAWEGAGLVRIKKDPYNIELFTLLTDKDSFNDVIAGGNFELVSKKLGKVGVSYFNIIDSEMDNRDGMSVYGLHARGNPIPSMPIFEVAGEVDFQKNSNPNVEAHAYFLEAKLFIPFLPWYPTVGYRYASFSGDKGSTSKNEGWDYLHNGATSNGFGYWYQGIVVGTYETRLSNLNTHFVNLTIVPPVQGSWAKILYYDHRFDDKSTAKIDGSAVSSNRFATEWDVIFGYSPSKKVDYMAIYGNATPGKGGKDRYAFPAPAAISDKNSTMLQFTVLVHF
ncbi:MAG: hypothetical protein PHY09_14565 [Desulfuromonadaceae bacterium]|nr:hypothetical protein [Desulfuromonadaceae bacterium]MDD5107036.1 hypothetical protein [Desulfuromonadaceae bacterium]